jgi:hypothetical protein
LIFKNLPFYQKIDDLYDQKVFLLKLAEMHSFPVNQLVSCGELGAQWQRRIAQQMTGGCETLTRPSEVSLNPKNH